jgi:pathogenesis-related protein 1
MSLKFILMQLLLITTFLLLPFFKQENKHLGKAPQANFEVVEINKEDFVDRHNYYRSKLEIDNVEWSDEIAEYAQKWANKLASTCSMTHRSGKRKYGENIAKTPSRYTEFDVVDLWASEEKYFNHKDKLFKKKNWQQYGHYSQMIWKDTRKIGAGAAICKSSGMVIWVCNYNPPGNFFGEKVY